MKKLQLIIITILALYTQPSVAKLNIFTCEPEWAALANEIGGNKVKAFSATHGKQDPHYIQARPSLIAKIRKADLLICTGAELEIGWLPLLLRKSANKDIQPGEKGYFITTSFVKLLDKGGIADRSRGDVHTSGNPHIHADPRRLAQVAEKLSVVMQQLDPNNADYYQQNSQLFLDKWHEAIIVWQTQAEVLKGRKIIAHHKSWIYLANWLNLEIIAYLEPKPGVAPTTSHLSSLLKTSESQQVDMIIYAAYQNPKSAKWLEKRSKIAAIELPFTIGGNKQTDDLFSFFDDTIKRLVGAVK
ncbi:MAG: zinc ABC transporter substrate-binding protein [Alcanivoracaceae bacterium]|nr:zinc ABC transporter substrate-binding protein [Alcanivoracaceae bacterium]